MKKSKSRTSLKRMAIIYKVLNTRPRSKREIIEEVEFFLGQYICESQIEKDLFFMRNELDFEIQYDKMINKYWINQNQDFIEQIVSYFQLDEVL